MLLVLFPIQVIARGKIIHQWVKVQSVGVISSNRFRILPEMSPTSRLVAFFVGQEGEVVADSTLLEIDDGLPNKVSEQVVINLNIYLRT